MWDYAGDNYVHRLIQSKTDGKLVELNSHCTHASDGCGSCDCVDSGFSEALLNSRVEAVMNLLPIFVDTYHVFDVMSCDIRPYL